jgi:hypothetical protein
MYEAYFESSVVASMKLLWFPPVTIAAEILCEIFIMLLQYMLSDAL